MITKLFFWPDTHWPYHDKNAVKLAFKAARAFKPDHLIVGGDLFDFYAVSDYSKHPKRKALLADELEGATEFIQELEALAPKRTFLEGNHEFRLEKYLCTQAPQLFGITSTQKVLGLDRWKFVPFTSHTKLGSLFLCHTPGAGGKYAVHKAHELYQHNVAFFHTHNLGISYTGNAAGTTHVSANFGWLGGIKFVDYTTNIEKLRRYVHGVGIGYMRTGGDVHLQTVPFVRNVCMIEGKEIQL